MHVRLYLEFVYPSVNSEFIPGMNKDRLWTHAARTMKTKFN